LEKICHLRLQIILVKSKEKVAFIMAETDQQTQMLIDSYKEEADATGWFGPEVLFGLSYAYVQRSQLLLDIGIGTGLGSDLFRKAGLEVCGMDNSQQMLEACRIKGIKSLQLHDLRISPYPYESASFDHAVCSGVMNFFNDLSVIFAETSRLLKNGGLFAFVVGDRTQNDPAAIIVGPEHTHTDEPVTMYRHSREEISNWLDANNFKMLRNLPFSMFLDRDHTRRVEAKAYITQRP
jgi:predicted TPR repeat methyltransferase